MKYFITLLILSVKSLKFNIYIENEKKNNLFYYNTKDLNDKR